VRSSSALSVLRNLVSEGVHKSETIVLLAAKGVLSRPWCLIELLEAKRKEIPIVVVEIAGRGVDRKEARAFVTGLEAEMARPGLKLLHTLIGPDLGELQEACLQMLDLDEKFFVLDPPCGRQRAGRYDEGRGRKAGSEDKARYPVGSKTELVEVRATSSLQYISHHDSRQDISPGTKM
jgi:hypothetical protein